MPNTFHMLWLVLYPQSYKPVAFSSCNSKHNFTYLQSSGYCEWLVVKSRSGVMTTGIEGQPFILQCLMIIFTKLFHHFSACNMRGYGMCGTLCYKTSFALCGSQTTFVGFTLIIIEPVTVTEQTRLNTFSDITSVECCCFTWLTRIGRFLIDGTMWFQNLANSRVLKLNIERILFATTSVTCGE